MLTEAKNTVIRYVRHPWTGALVGCVVAVKTEDGIKYGWSQCNKLDTFNRKVGRNIAIQRALCPPSEPLTPAATVCKVYNPQDGMPVHTLKGDVITPALEDIKVFAETVAFAPKPVRPTDETLPEGLHFNEDKTAILDTEGNLVARIRVKEEEVSS